jgi:hypothetical protein
MKTKNLMKLQTLLLVLFVSMAMILGACKKDKTTVPDGDKTTLNALIVTSEATATAADTSNYEQADIDAYKTSVASIKTASLAKLTQSQVDALVQQLTEVNKTFASKIIGFIDESLYLVAGWHFDEGTGTTATSYSTGAQVATFAKGWTAILGSAALLPTWVDGVKGGKAIYLDKGAHLEVPYSPSLLPANISISVWIKNNLAAWENNCIVSQNYWWGYKFQTQDHGKPLFTERINATTVQDYDAQVDYIVPPLIWTHVAVTLNSTTKVLEFYVNGLKIHTFIADPDNVGALTQTLSFTDVNYTYTAQPFLIGSFATDAEIAAKPLNFNWISAANVASFEGAMDELKIFNTALTSGQVKRIYKDEKP